LSEVSIVKAKPIPDESIWESSKRLLAIKDLLRDAIEITGGFGKAVEGADTVVIKPNLLVAVPPDMHLTTDPHITASLVELVKESGVKRVIVAEGPALIHKGREVFRVTLTEKFCSRAGAEIAYLDESEHVEVDIPDANIMRKTRIPKLILESDALITVPKMKTHWLCGVTLGIKNLVGVIPLSERMRGHREDIHQRIVDILRLVKPDFAVIDGLVAMDGQGPRCGNLVKMSTVIAGCDAVSVDTVACAVMGIEPSEIAEIRLANAQGLGVGELGRIAVKGERVESVKKAFKRASRDIAGVFPNVESYLGGACKGCLGFTRATLDALNLTGDLQKSGRISLIMGFGLKDLPEDLNGTVIVIGDCTCEHAARGTFIKGCPAYEVYFKIPAAIGVKAPSYLAGSETEQMKQLRSGEETLS